MLILYTTEDGRSEIRLRAEDDTVWLSQLEMAALFDATKQNISLHFKNIFEDGELREDSVVKESLTTAADGKAYLTKLYNLEATRLFFASVQNALLYAVTEKTAAELVTARANLRLVSRQVGHLVADHPAHAHRLAQGRRRRGPARIRGDDDHGQDRCR